MRIAVNVCAIRPGQVGGAEEVARRIIDELLAVEQAHTYLLLTSDFNHHTFAHLGPRVKRRCVYFEGWGNGWSARLGRLTRGIRKKTGFWSPPPSLTEVLLEDGVDLLWCPMAALEPATSCVPSVVTIHDLQHAYFPEFFSPAELEHRKSFYAEVAKKATFVAPISEATGQSLQEKLGMSPERIRAIPIAGPVDCTRPVDTASVQATKRRLGRPSGPILLYPANPWPHKNHARLIEAFSLANRDRQQRHEPLAHLVLTGSMPEGGTDPVALAAQHGVSSEVHYLGYVERAELLALYHAATILVYPSLFEGFGIPLLEAMTCGCPVIASTATSLPEVGGEAAWYVDPLDVAEWSRRINWLLDSQKEREALVAKGVARAAELSFERTATEYLSLFSKAAEKHGTSARSATPDVDGVWPDGWSGQRFFVAVGQGRSVKTLSCRFHLQADVGLVPMKIEVRGASGRQLERTVSTAGDQELELDFPAPERYFTFRSSRSFVPRDLGINEDSRRLSIRWLSMTGIDVMDDEVSIF